MVSTTQIKPAPALQPFVNCYALRSFNTGQAVMPQAIHAIHEYFLSFFLKDKFCDVKFNSDKVERKSSSLISFLTESLGCVYYKGDFVIFSVQFKPNGLFAIFGIPQKMLLDSILPVEEILANDNNLLCEQLESSRHINEMGNYMNAYLTGRLQRQKNKIYTPAIAGISNIILRNKGNVSLDRLAYYANMSSRNFERRFVHEMGIPPKLYARIVRFNYALENKMLHPNKKWTDITYENGYFDQAHFIKEVRTFSSKTPEELFKDTPPPTENFIAKVEH